MNETIIETANEIIMFMGYTFPITSSPIIDVYIITIFASLFITLINKHFTDQPLLKRSKEEMKSLQKEMRKVMRENPKKAQALQKEIFKKNMVMMKQNLNPKIMLMTMLPMILIFIFIKNNYTQFDQFLNLGFATFGWLGTYIIFSIINSVILKKLLKVA